METTDLSTIVLYDEIGVFLHLTVTKSTYKLNPTPYHMFVQIILIALSVWLFLLVPVIVLL